MLQVAEEEEGGMRMGKKVLKASLDGQSPSGKGSHSKSTEQHLLLFPVHSVAALMHGLGMLGVCW